MPDTIQRYDVSDFDADGYVVRLTLEKPPAGPWRIVLTANAGGVVSTFDLDGDEAEMLGGNLVAAGPLLRRLQEADAEHLNVVTNRGEPHEWRGTLAELASVNDDEFDAEQVVEIAATVRGGEVYRGGGGAAAAWTVEAA